MLSDSDEDVFFELDDSWDEACSDSSHKRSSPASSRNGRNADAAERDTFFDARPTQTAEDARMLYPAHAAAFDGEVLRLVCLLRNTPPEKINAFDAQGNTVLHVAVLRQNKPLVRALLQLGMAGMKKNSRGWLPLDEAVALKNRELVELLYYHMLDTMKAQVKAKRKGLLQSMQDMPDHHLTLQWELGSPVFGFILRRYAPNDTYQVWKRGTQIRVDGTLMGIDKESSGIVPHWRRGAFSLLFDGGVQPSRMLLLDRDNRRYFDLQKEKKAAKRDRATEVRHIMTEGAGKTKMKTSDFHFKPQKTLFGNPSTEKVSGWKTRIYEATSKLVAVTSLKEPVVIPPHSSFEDYISMDIPEDRTQEMPIDPLSMNGLKAPAGAHSHALDSGTDPEEAAAMAAAEAHAKQKGGRKITARCWMAEEFPISLAQLLPLLDVIGYANKYLKRVGKFMRKYGEMQLFPVKLQVPLLFTVYLLLLNKSFRVLQPDDPAMKDDFFAVPSDFELKALKKTGMFDIDGDGGLEF